MTQPMGPPPAAPVRTGLPAQVVEAAAVVPAQVVQAAAVVPAQVVQAAAVVAAAPSVSAYVDVSVATLWHSPASPRGVDQPALRQPVGVRSWLSSMTLRERLALNGRVDSQLILGERVVVDQRAGSWAHVVVPDQPTPLDPRGYPGWIPLRQLTFRLPTTSARDAVVVAPTAWLYTATGTTRLLEVSMATRLPVIAADPTWVHTETPDGTAVLVRATDVKLVSRGAAALPASGVDVVRTAHEFDGLPYLWGGTSGFGLDCSGFTHLVFAMRGVTIPRDADAQAKAGVAVTRANLRPGDLVFFASNGVTHHVGIYVGDGLMLHAPNTGSRIQLVSLAAQPYASQYSGARRYVTG
jgi:gamma-D-glutamyl-L-lysine dipeptidyl-peptidase